MSLTWQIVKKDLRRLMWPLAVWLLFGLMRVVLALRMGRGEDAGEFVGLGYLANTFAVIDAAVGFLLAAWLVMEDSLVSARAFWPTRPISGARLLGAKLLGAVLMFGVLPVLVMMPVWLGCGFSLGETLVAAAKLCGVHGFWVLFALALACATETSGQFLVRMLFGIPVAFYVLSRTLSNVGEPGLQESRIFLMTTLVLLSPVVVVVNQFLTRRTKRSWSLAAVMVGMAVASAWLWPWDFSPLLFRIGSRNVATDHPQDGAIRFAMEGSPVIVPATGAKNPMVAMQLSAAGAAPGDYVSANHVKAALVSSAAKTAELFFAKKGEAVASMANVARGLMNLPALAENEGANFRLTARTPKGQVTEATAGNYRLQGEVNATLMRGRVLGEIPFKEGAEMRVGAVVARIASITRNENRVVVTIDERDAGGVVQDCYALVNRRTGFNQSLGVNGPETLETLETNFIRRGFRQIEILPPQHDLNGRVREDSDWEEGAVLVKVRFTPVRTFVRTWESAQFQLGPGPDGSNQR